MEEKRMARGSKTMDGNQAAACAAYYYSDVAAIYPITPSTTMAELMDEWAAAGKKNLFGQTVQVTQFQSEAGAAGAMHGALLAGALTSTFTASQGLLLMIPNLYKMAGEQLPGVFHVAARTIAVHALSIFGDHSDIYACRQTGAALLCSATVQEVMDLAPVAHIAAVAGRLPFVHFFDGFRTSHEIQKIAVWSEEDMKALADEEAILRFRQGALTPEHGKEMGSAQNPDVFFQFREAANRNYERLPELVQKCLDAVNIRIGTDYHLFEYYGAEDAEEVIVAMGSVCGTIEETVDFLNASGRKTGLIKVRLYRPFSIEHFIRTIPGTVRHLTVLDRTKEPGGPGEPLYLDVAAALKEGGREEIRLYGGRYGLASKDTTPKQIAAVFENHKKKHFTIGIEDDVTHMSLKPAEWIPSLDQDYLSCKFWGFGGDGTVGANKNSVKIIGDHTKLYAQAYFSYDSKKSRGLTVSHLRFGKRPIRSAYLVYQADFAACHNPVYMHKYDMVQEVKDGGVFLLNCPYEGEALERFLPGQVKRYMAEHHIRFYTIDAIRIGKEIGLNSRVNTILQAAFFKLSGILPKEEGMRFMKEAARQAYLKKGEKIVEMNYRAIERGMEEVRKIEVPEHWKEAEEEPLDTELIEDRAELLEFVEKIQKPLEKQEGDKLPVSAFLDRQEGSVPSGSAAHERRNVSVEIPFWKPENCIQCNRCAYVCPHAVIRPFVLNEEEQKKATEGMKVLPMTGMSEYGFCIAVSETDCTGCGSCVGVCPGRQGEKALEMCPVGEHTERQDFFDYAKALRTKKEVLDIFRENTVKGSQFKRPLLEFHGACAGCGETPYAKLVTQLFGERMYIANATGCSSIWGNSYPSTPYAVNWKGQGPAWANSLFEDAAEFGYGMYLSGKAVRERLKKTAIELLSEVTGEGRVENALKLWLSNYDRGAENQAASEQLKEALKTCDHPLAKKLLSEQDSLAKKSYWIFGGDGWAYDIGFSGLDHVLASGQDINILVFDTEVYSNTGGQVSKATPEGASAKFAADGKRTGKKNLAAMAMTYGNAYVAQVAMGADYNQTLQALLEAERYPGPALVIAYSPCISHGIKAGMGSAQHEEKKAVEAGYWHLFRFDPSGKEAGQNPFRLDSKVPKLSYEQFLDGEIRYTSLKQRDPEAAESLFAKAAKRAEEKYEELKKWERG